MVEDIEEIAYQQKWAFPLDYPLVLNAEGFEDWGKFQKWLKVIGFINQGAECICGKELTDLCDLHHALITRKDYKSTLIHSSYNVVVCHKECHPKLNREQCFKFLSDIFGEQTIRSWYDSVRNQMKSKMRNLP